MIFACSFQLVMGDCESWNAGMWNGLRNGNKLPHRRVCCKLHVCMYIYIYYVCVCVSYIVLYVISALILHRSCIMS